MKEIILKQKISKDRLDFINIYSIVCMDYYYKSKKFKVVPVSELYNSDIEALEAIKSSVRKVDPNYGYLHHLGDKEYELIFEHNNSYVKRSYKIVQFSLDSRDLIK